MINSRLACARLLFVPTAKEPAGEKDTAGVSDVGFRELGLYIRRANESHRSECGFESEREQFPVLLNAPPRGALVAAAAPLYGALFSRVYSARLRLWAFSWLSRAMS